MDAGTNHFNQRPLSSTYSSSRSDNEVTCVTTLTSTYRNTNAQSLMRMTKQWALEVLSCLIGCASLAAIVGTLHIHEHRPLPNWPKLISINSLIAIFTAVMKAALLMPVAEGLCQLKWQHFSSRSRAVVDLDTFDSASRGPWGSLLLLFKTPKLLLASLGAVITVVALAIDPFSQQVIGYYGCPQPLSGTRASIPRTNKYSQTGDKLNNGTGISMSSNMTAAIYLGLYNPPANASALIPFHCPTGNCTFPMVGGATYSSLGMCHDYEDITATIHNRSSEDIAHGIFRIRHASISYGFAPDDNTALATVSNSSKDPSSFFAFDTLTFSCASNHTKDCRQPYAFRSSFYPCVRTYGAAIKSFVLEEKELHSTPLRPYKREGKKVDWILAANTTIRNGVLHDCTPTPTRTPENVVEFDSDASRSRSSNTSAAYYPADCIWNVTADAITSFQAGLNGILHSRNMSYLDRAQRTETQYMFFLRLGNNYSADAGSVKHWLAQLTDSMTASMRQAGDIESYARGSVWENQTCIEVQWEWLGLPASLLVLSAIFTSVVIIQSTRSPEQPVWKSSDLVLLYHGFRDSTIADCGVLETAQDMEELSKTLKARLVLDEEKRWRFEPSETSSLV